MDARRRDVTIAEARTTEFDLVVVGGGINGAGIAHDAALRGLKVCLIEAQDLAFGTSSRSSKLIHGGLRYLEHYHFKLVFEGTNERAMLRKLAPHLVRALDATGWKVSGEKGAAALLKINVSTLNSRLRALGIRRPRAS